MKVKERTNREIEKLKQSASSFDDTENIHIASPNEKLMKLEKEENNLEIEKIKMLNDIDCIIGISELNVQNTLSFIDKQKITNINIIVDPEKDIKVKNKFDSRFEAIVEKDNLIDYKSDPTVNALIFQYSTFAYFTILCLLICGSGVHYCVKRSIHYKGFIENYKEIYDRSFLASKVNYE